MTLPLESIQGNITPGFRKDHQAFLFFQWAASDVDAVKTWIRAIRPRISHAREVADFNRRYRLRKAELPRGETPDLYSTWVNVAFSARGLKGLLTEDELKKLPLEFTAEPGTRLADVDDPALRDTFEFGGTIATLPDAVVLIGADSKDALDAAIVDQLDLAKPLEPMRDPYIGKSLGDRREHFGFRDSISQPDPEDPLSGWDEDRPDVSVVRPGEFILGLDREPRPVDPAARNFPDWAELGSFLVFRKLQQHVAAFEAEVQDAMAAVQAVYDEGASGPDADRPPLLDGVTPALMKAKLVGRWASGRKLNDLPTPPLTEDPGHGTATLSDLAVSDRAIAPGEFGADKFGGRCPLSSHIRKAHPRNLPEARHHRIIRRGITFGPEAQRRDVDDGEERGIFFVAYQASIAEQFEFIQRNWLNASDPAEPVLSGADLPSDVSLGSLTAPGWDPIAAIRPKSELGMPSEGQLALQFWKNGSFKRINFPTNVGESQPVTVRATGYFLAPSIPAIEDLGRR